MKVAPTLEGGLVIEPSSDLDWEVLSMISKDIGRPAHLAESLADLMSDDSEWEEYVVPDIAANFDQQSNYVEAVIKKARERKEPAIFIKSENAGQWYGATNQARLALEARYKLSESDDFESVPTVVRSAHFRDRFYSMLQTMLLEYVLEDS